MCNESRLPSLRGSRLGINMDSSLKTRPCSVELSSPIAPTAAQVLKLRCFWLLSYSYSMKWYSYSMPYLRVRVRVLLTRSTSTKSQGKHRLKLRNMRIAQLQSANSGSWACSVLREIQLGGNHVESMVESRIMLITLRHRRTLRSGRRIRL